MMETRQPGETIELNSQESENFLVTLSKAFGLSWKHRVNIVVIVAIATLLAAAVSFIIPKKYIAETTILPDIDMINLASKLGSLAEIASAAGLNTGVTSPSELNPDIISSETILRKVIYHKYKVGKFDSLVNLIQYWSFDDESENMNFEKCVDMMQKKVMSISVDKKTQILTLDIETNEAQLSADIANQFSAELDDFQRNFRKTNASAQRKFLEGRLDEVKQDLRKAEDELKEFREKNRRIEQSPQLLLEQDRLSRAVDLNSTLFIELEKQYELAKLDEIKNTPVVQILDVARPPAQKSSPHRVVIVVLGFLISFIFANLYWLIVEYIKSKPDDPEIREMISAFQTVKNDLPFRKKS
jgi:uncharacterized protein involved in exopolysaccharide biosynthesis